MTKGAVFARMYDVFLDIHFVLILISCGIYLLVCEEGKLSFDWQYFLEKSLSSNYGGTAFVEHWKGYSRDNYIDLRRQNGILWPMNTSYHITITLKICCKTSMCYVCIPRDKTLRTWDLIHITWWHHQMETFSALLALCAGNSPVTGEFPSQRPVTRSFGVFFHLCPNKQLSKQSWGWWFENPIALIMTS